METRISDLLTVIHSAIILNSASKENIIILDELKSIDEKIRTGQLKDYAVDEITFFKSIINTYQS